MVVAGDDVVDLGSGFGAALAVVELGGTAMAVAGEDAGATLAPVGREALPSVTVGPWSLGFVHSLPDETDVPSGPTR